ncbi:MAG: hypothetical protein ABSC11_10730 [Smithella sp.]
MKRIILSAMVLVMLLISIGGCWPWKDEGARDRRHDQDGTHGDSEDQEGPGGPGGGGPGGAGGGH